MHCSNLLVLDVQGVGYGVEVPLSVVCQLPQIGEPMSLWVYTYVREDSLKLYGFFTFSDKKAFELLIGLNGVGPKLGLAILSTISVSALKNAIATDKKEVLEGVPGVGPRVSARILLELRPKLSKLSAVPSVINSESVHQQTDHSPLGITEIHDENDRAEQMFHDLHSALENLGFKANKIDPLLQKLRQNGVSTSFPLLMKKALQILTDPKKKKNESANHLDVLF